MAASQSESASTFCHAPFAKLPPAFRDLARPDYVKLRRGTPMSTARFLAAALIVAGVSGCAHEERIAQVPGCHTQVVVEVGKTGFDLGREHALNDLAKETKTQLTYDRWLGGRRYLLGLQTKKSADRCENALARLRDDDRVKSAELDERRSANGAWGWSSNSH
jgi:hypothetical protein